MMRNSWKLTFFIEGPHMHACKGAGPKASKCRLGRCGCGWCAQGHQVLVGHCYAYGLLLTHTKSTYGLITILAVYETARAYPGITPYVYFLIYLVLCSSFRGSRLMYCTKVSNG